MANNGTQELVVSGLDEETINRIATFADAFAAAQGTNISQSDMLYEASSYPLLEDKMKLIGVPFIITQAKFSESKKFKGSDGIGNSFVILYIVTDADEKFTITDGSTGIAAQVSAEILRRNTEGIVPANQMIFVKNGLTVSEYEYTDDKGNVSDARTFYLA